MRQGVYYWRSGIGGYHSTSPPLRATGWLDWIAGVGPHWCQVGFQMKYSIDFAWLSSLSLSRCLVGSSGNGAKQFNQTDPFPNGVRAATASMMWRMVPDLSAAHVLSYPFSASSDVCPMRPIPQMDPPFPSSYSARLRRFFSPAPIGYRVETFLRPHAAIPTRPT